MPVVFGSERKNQKPAEAKRTTEREGDRTRAIELASKRRVSSSSSSRTSKLEWLAVFMRCVCMSHTQFLFFFSCLIDFKRVRFVYRRNILIRNHSTENCITSKRKLFHTTISPKHQMSNVSLDKVAIVLCVLTLHVCVWCVVKNCRGILVAFVELAAYS